MATDVAAPGVLPRSRRTRGLALNLGAWLLVAPAAALMLFAFLAPMVIIFKYSFWTYQYGVLSDRFSFAAYTQFLTNDYYHSIVWQTLKMAAEVMVLTILVSYPIAYAMWRIRSAGLRTVLAVIVFSPMVVSVVVRSYGWSILLGDTGPLNWLLQQVHLIGSPIPLVFNMTGVIIAMVHIFLPFVVFPIYSAMTKIDPSLKEAAQDLGANWLVAFRRVTVPLTLPGVVAGAQISFTLALGAFVTPSLLGGGRVQVLPLEIYNDTTDINWPIAAVGGITLLVLSFVAVALFNWLLRFSSTE